MKYTSLVELPNTHQFRCNTCGCNVVDTKLHDDWHKSINLIATDLYGVDTELD